MSLANTSIGEDLRRPLSEIIRPSTIENVIGQAHLLNAKNGAITNFITLGYLPSMILHGPPGVGKTTLARLLADETNYVFVEFSATDATVSQLRELSEALTKENTKRTRLGRDRLRVVVFIDEIHRFTVVQQDFLLPFVESGVFVFVGATTVSPEKRIRRAILSRCQLFELKQLSEEELTRVVDKAIVFENIRRRIILNLEPLRLEPGSSEIIAHHANGDGRTAVNFVELLSSRVSKEANSSMSKTSVETAVRSLVKERSGIRHESSIELLNQLVDFMNQKEPEEGVFPDERPEFVRYEFDEKRRTCKVIINYKAAKAAASDLESCYDQTTAQTERFSDDENDEKGAIYSDNEEETHLTNRISRTKYFVRAAAHTMLQLLSRGESASLIMKQMLLFNCAYIDVASSLLHYVMGVTKSFEKATFDIPVALTNCAERLILAPKSKDEPLKDVLKSLKMFFSSQRQSVLKVVEDHTFKVVYSEALVKLLLEDPGTSALQKKPRISSLNIDHEFREGDYTLGAREMALLEGN